ncbi:uncharacterized protein LOC126894036 [Daktulosphaira vitifoliae]|uniref:uncharacterized protein LOC126894036 n=1 Tax=Daktulosphaira vitifoliae TaxID=58002 RepID=UPI0021AA069D|nr:uncharacterized protein LOC126894036 [Daktulosphaira vitifoliae]
MIKKFILFMLIIIWYLSKALTVSSHQTNISENFKDYIIKSLSHICKQSGWNALGHIQFQKRDYTINNYCIIKDSVNDNNYLEKLECIINILNCEYTIVMENFNVMLGMVLDKCRAEKIKSNMKQFEYCIKGIFDIFKNLIKIFSNFLNAAKYINQIDLRIINLSLSNSKCIENEIQLFCSHLSKVVEQYVNFVQLKDIYFLNIFGQMMNFHNNVKQIIFYLYKIRKVCGSHYESLISTNLLTVYNIEQMDKLVDDSNDYVKNIYNDLSTYLAVISENHFSSLGFEQLLGTNTFKFKHYTRNAYNTNDGINIIKTLMSHDGWKFWKHIAIKHKMTNCKKKHFNELIVPVNLENYKLIRACTTQILRCRYIEIFEYFNNMLNRLITFCQFNNKNSCAITIFNIILKSDEMFKNMLFALKTLRYMAIRHLKHNASSCIELQIEFFRDFIFDMRRKYQSSSEFVSQEYNYYEATEFLNDIRIFTQKELSIKIMGTLRYSKTYCEFERYSDLYDFMKMIEKLINIDTDCISDCFNNYQAIIEIFSEFMEKINKENYKNLGFNKIPKQ